MPLLKKPSKPNKTDPTEGGVNPKLVFSNDALVIDYLNSLLASVPSINLSSGEIHFVHMAFGSDWGPSGLDDSSVRTPLIFDNNLFKIDAEELIKENETLKFTTELAEIDSQVLRSENENLKVKIAQLVNQLEEMQDSFDTVVNLNRELQSRKNKFTNRSDSSISVTTDVLPSRHVNSECTEDLSYISTGSLDAASGEPFDYCDVAPQDIINERVPDIPHIGVLPNTSLETSPSPAKADQDLRLNHKATLSIDSDRVIISRLAAGSSDAKQSAFHDTTVFSHKHGMADPPVQSVRSVSKVIKKKTSMKHQSNQIQDKTQKDLSLEHVQLVNGTLLSEQKADLILHQLTGTIPIEEEKSLPKTDSPHIDNTDEIDLEPAPAPKVVVRRHMKNYEELQKETETTNTTVSGHTVVL